MDTHTTAYTHHNQNSPSTPISCLISPFPLPLENPMGNNLSTQSKRKKICLHQKGASTAPPHHRSTLNSSIRKFIVTAFFGGGGGVSRSPRVAFSWLILKYMQQDENFCSLFSPILFPVSVYGLHYSSCFTTHPLQLHSNPSQN